MPGTRSARIYDSIGALPPEALTQLGRGGLFSSPAWFDVVEQHAIPPGSRPGYVLDQEGAGVMPVLRTGRRIDALTTPYTCAYTPAATAGEAFGRLCRSGGVSRIDAVPAEWDGRATFLAGLRAVGLIALPFEHFGNWSEDVAGRDWDAYLASRPGALRETVRRRLRQAERRADARFEILAAPAEMDRAAAVYEDVYARSWKEPEPYPAFNVALMRAMAELGALRLGVWSIGETAVAVQLWVVWDGTANVLKLAHDEAFKAHSPGTVLTALMLRYLLEQMHVGRIDFGRGDDAYKRGWTSERRQRIGFLVANPWHPAGAAALLRHAAGRMRRMLRSGRRDTDACPAPD
jgi:CelD/BcsL family acetyltransferase involved in cellulose biosynthesis